MVEIVGLDAGQVVLVAEAKWTNEPVGMDVLRNLQRRVALLPKVAGDHPTGALRRKASPTRCAPYKIRHSRYTRLPTYRAKQFDDSV